MTKTKPHEITILFYSFLSLWNFDARLIQVSLGGGTLIQMSFGGGHLGGTLIQVSLGRVPRKLVQHTLLLRLPQRQWELA